jgi:hypothetical protein
MNEERIATCKISMAFVTHIFHNDFSYNYDLDTDNSQNFDRME